MHWYQVFTTAPYDSKSRGKVRAKEREKSGKLLVLLPNNKKKFDIPQLRIQTQLQKFKA